MKKIIKTLCFAAVALVCVSLAACGEKGFKDFAEYITSNGALSADGSFYSVGKFEESNDYRAIYYPDDDELVLGLRAVDENRTDALLLVLSDDSDVCDLLFTRIADGATTPEYAGMTALMLSSPVCISLTLASGSQAGEKDYSMVTLVNTYITLLLAAQDDVFAEAGLTMADLGFVYPQTPSAV